MIRAELCNAALCLQTSPCRGVQVHDALRIEYTENWAIHSENWLRKSGGEYAASRIYNVNQTSTVPRAILQSQPTQDIEPRTASLGF